MGARTGPVSNHRENCDHGTGGVTGARSIEDILAVNMTPYIDYIGDNARAHTAKIVQDYITEVGFRVMEKPACSPDLNATEYL